MKIRYYLVIIFCSIFSISLKCQNNSLQVGVGISHFNLNQVRDFQFARLNSMSIPAKLVYDFPASLSFNAKYLRAFKNIYIGGLLCFSSTPSRISYGDYSGQLNFDIISSSYSFGPLARIDLFQIRKFSFCTYLNILFNYTNEKFKDQITIYKSSTSLEEYTFHSLSIGVQPGIDFCYLYSRFVTGVDFGYHLDAGNKLYFIDDENSYLAKKGKSVYSNISGIRLSLYFGIKF